MNNTCIQTILVPFWDTLPDQALAYAKLFSNAYNKPIALLKLGKNKPPCYFESEYPISHSTKDITEAINDTITSQDSVMVIWQYQRNSRQIQRMLNACRDLRIPYFFIANDHSTTIPQRVTLPVSFLIEDREKATWARSLHLRFNSEYTILKPQDKGSRAAKNVKHIEDFLDKNAVPFRTIQGRRSSFKNDKESLRLFSDNSDLIIITASREYGLDDTLFGPKERKLIKGSNIPIMMINPRGDLYVLCGD